MPRKPKKSRQTDPVESVRRVCFVAAVSLDGYLAGPNGEVDWILMDPDIDFGNLFKRFDTVLMGRRTFEGVKRAQGGTMPGMQTCVCSTTLKQEENPGIIVTAEPQALIAELLNKPGKDVWLFGGGSLFRSLLEANLVHTVELAVIPVLLGAGIPWLPSPAKQVKLKLHEHQVYSKTGIVSLKYDVAAK